MRIFLYLYIIFIKSLFITFFTSLSIFIIFSLIGNFGENFSFFKVIKLSILNAFQIYTYVPCVFFIITMYIQNSILRSNNEFMIIKSYIKMRSLLLYIMPILLLFSFLEINKKKGTDSIDEIKSNLLSSNNNSDFRLILNEEINSSNYTILKNINFEEKNVGEIVYFETNGNIINKGIFSNDIEYKNKIFTFNSPTVFLKNIISIKSDEIKLSNNLDNFRIKKITNLKNESKDKFYFNIFNLNSYFFTVIYYFILFYIFFSKEKIQKNNKILKELVFLIFLFIYFLINISINFENFHFGFYFLSSLIILLLLIRLQLNE